MINIYFTLETTAGSKFAKMCFPNFPSLAEARAYRNERIEYGFDKNEVETKKSYLDKDDFKSSQKYWQEVYKRTKIFEVIVEKVERYN